MRRIVTVAVVVIATLLGLPAVASASSADGGGAADYVALGDSYASGVGTRISLPDSGACARSPLAYPSLFRTTHRIAGFAFSACSGATIADVADQLGAVTRQTDLVTLTAGGNDVGFGAVLGACSGPPPSPEQCDAAVAAGTAAVQHVGPDMEGLLDRIRARASAHTEIVVLGYPLLFGEGPCTAPGLPDASARAAIDDGTRQLNRAIQKAAEAKGALFVDVSGRFARHGSCAEPASRWVNPPTTPPDASYHPNVRGHALGYLPALDGALRHAVPVSS
jgi:lysophospholipase L1-like esterase